MTVFVTGGYGQIASWAVYYLAKAGRDVVVYDLNPQPPDYLDEVAGKITFVKGDVLDMARLADTIKKYQSQIDGIIHTVGIMGELVQQNAYYNMRLNVMGLVNVMEMARIFNIKKVLYTSTGAVYGLAQGIVPEDTPLAPTDLYASTKVSSEHLGMQFANTFGLDFRVARVYFVYGPGKLPSNFINLYRMAFGALQGIQGLKMDKGGEQKLDFTYAEDAGRGVAVLYQAENPPHQIYNLATGKASSVGEAIELSKKYTHYPVEVDIGPGELMKRCEALDVSRAEAELGFSTQYSLEDGIKSYAGWLKKQLG